MENIDEAKKEKKGSHLFLKRKKGHTYFWGECISRSQDTLTIKASFTHINSKRIFLESCLSYP